MPVNVCGQMSGSPTYTMLLLGLGLRQFSVHAAARFPRSRRSPQRDDRAVPGRGAKRA